MCQAVFAAPVKHFRAAKFARISDQLMKKRFSSAHKFATQEWW
jgi:hypothetical protein